MMKCDTSANEQNLKMMLDMYAPTDPDFARDYKRKDKSIKECMKLFSDALVDKVNSGGLVSANAQTVLAWAIHYYHEDKLTKEDVDFTGMEESIKKPINTPSASTKKATTPSNKKKTTTPVAKKAPADDLDLDLDEIPDVDLDLD